MKEQTQTGMNRTGVQASPLETGDMLADRTSTPVPPGDDSALAEVRSVYFEEAGTLGSVPLADGMAGASLPIEKSPQILLDKLGERLAFERTGTRLYDALIAKFDAKDDGVTGMTAEELQQIREDEARHFAILADAMETMGADPTAQTPCADVVGVETMGLMQVVCDPRTTLAQSLHAMLIAEMADQNGWEMLIMLAEENGQNSMITDFTVALNEERMHLQQVQKWYEEATLGSSVSDEANDPDLDMTPPQLH